MKVLARSKGSAIIVLLAPLIIVFIIGLGFMDSQEIQLNIGVYEEQPSNLTTRYIKSFDTEEHLLINYESRNECINSIRDGRIVLCAVFSEDFEIRDGAKNELTFYVDESRMNLADRLISSFSASITLETTDISEELTEQLIQIIEISNEKAEESLTQTIQNRAQLTTAKQELEEAEDAMTELDTTRETINIQLLQTKTREIEKDYEELEKSAENIVKKGIDLELEDEDLKDAIIKLNETLNDTKEGLDNIQILKNAVNTVSVRITNLENRIEKAETIKTQVTQNIEELKDAITTFEENTNKIKQNQEEILSAIESFELRTARTISSPVNTEIESVASTKNRLTYSFSYLLTLAILFVGLMLSSTLVYLEKDSKAFFRNYTTPTTQKYFTLINYLTSLIIITIQTILILAIAHFTLNIPILTNALVTSIFLFLGITLFITIGLLIGLLSSTSEAVTMSTIVIGSIFLFLSNLILPLETLSPLVSKIAEFNPYVIVSEGIRKSMLFETPLEQAYPEIIFLTIYIVVIVTIMMLINQLGLKHFLATRRHRKNLLITQPENLELEIKGHKKRIKNLDELVQFLQTLKEEEYKEITKEHNPISDWLKNNLEKKQLARKLKRKKKLSQAIKVIEKYQKKKKK